MLFFPGISHAAPQYSDCLGKLLQQDNGVWLHWGNASIGDLANLQALDDRDTDSHSDFLWRNAATGDIVVWRMVDLGLQDSAWLGNPGGSWQIFAK